MFFFLPISPPKPCTRFCSSSTCHIPSPSHSASCDPINMKCTRHEAPHYAVFSILLSVPISPSAPYSGIQPDYPFLNVRDRASHPCSTKIEKVMFSRLIERRLRLWVQAQYKSVLQYWHMAVTAVATVHIGNSVH